jgi:haloalkane dehalogenase
MGDSDKLGTDDPRRYTFARRREFLDALLEILGVGGDAVLVVHGWGSALGFDWARRRPGQVAAIVYMESLVRPRAYGTDGRRTPGRSSSGCVRLPGRN